MEDIPKNLVVASPFEEGLDQDWVSEQGKFAAIDLGTNNCRLLIVEPCQNSFKGMRVRDSYSQIVRLGEHVDETGFLSEEAQTRTIDALKICAHKLALHNIISYRAVTTHACRQAQNCQDFLDRVKRETGISLEIISSTEEAVLALKGCLPLLDPSYNYAIVFDIGGGSTEVIWTKVLSTGKAELLDQISLPFGVVSLSEKFGTDIISDAHFHKMVDLIIKPLVEFDQKNNITSLLNTQKVQLLGTSGTITTLAAVHEGLDKYSRNLIDGKILKVSQAKEVSSKLRQYDLEQRAALPCIGEERADLVIAGCAILEAICRQWPLEDISVADRGLRDGILSQLIAQHQRSA